MFHLIPTRWRWPSSVPNVSATLAPREEAWTSPFPSWQREEKYACCVSGTTQAGPADPPGVDLSYNPPFDTRNNILLHVFCQAKLIEFKPLRATDVKLPDGAVFVISNCCVEMNKAATSHFNIRVVECRIAAKVGRNHPVGPRWVSTKMALTV